LGVMILVTLLTFFISYFFPESISIFLVGCYLRDAVEGLDFLNLFTSSFSD